MEKIPFSVGIECETCVPCQDFELARARLMSFWEDTCDGSIRPPEEYLGVEFVSGVLRDEDIKNALVLFEKTANEFGFVTNNSCGTHIHIGVPDYMQATFGQDKFLATKKAILTYLLVEPILFAMTDHDRLNCGFCRPITNNVIFTNIMAANPKDLHKFLISLFSSRYMAVNFHAIKKHYTWEFRIPSGQSSTVEIYNYIVFLSRLIEVGATLSNKTIRAISKMSVESILTDILDLPENIALSIINQIIKFGNDRPCGLNHQTFINNVITARPWNYIPINSEIQRKKNNIKQLKRKRRALKTSEGLIISYALQTYIKQHPNPFFIQEWFGIYKYLKPDNFMRTISSLLAQDHADPVWIEIRRQTNKMFLNTPDKSVPRRTIKRS